MFQTFDHNSVNGMILLQVEIRNVDNLRGLLPRYLHGFLIIFFRRVRHIDRTISY